MIMNLTTIACKLYIPVYITMFICFKMTGQPRLFFEVNMKEC